MGNLFNSLNKLKTNIFGGKGNTGKTDPPASRVAKLGIKPTPTSRLEVDPMAFASFSYPRDVTNNVQNGHYMLFYVNVQNRSKFQYTNPYGKSLSTTKQVEVVEFTRENPNLPLKRKTKIIDVKGMNQGEKVYYQNRAKRAGEIGNVYGTVNSISRDIGVNLKSGIRNVRERNGIGS